MSRSRIILVSACVVIFASGMAVGYSLSRASMERRLDQLLSRATLDPESWLVATLQERLALSEQQTASLRAAYRSTEATRQYSRITTRPIINQAAYELMADLEKILTPNQRTNLNALLDESWMITRPPCFRDIFPKLSLTMDQRQKFDAVLAREAPHIAPEPSTVPEQFCSELLRRTAETSSEFLEPRQVEILANYAARPPK